MRTFTFSIGSSCLRDCTNAFYCSASTQVSNGRYLVICGKGLRSVSVLGLTSHQPLGRVTLTGSNPSRVLTPGKVNCCGSSFVVLGANNLCQINRSKGIISGGLLGSFPRVGRRKCKVTIPSLAICFDICDFFKFSTTGKEITLPLCFCRGSAAKRCPGGILVISYSS